MRLEQELEASLAAHGGLDTCSEQALYEALLHLVRSMQKNGQAPTGTRKLYYISAEFLIGKLLASNLTNLGIYADVDGILRKHGRSLAQLEELEPEPSLGNGGLGRLAACFLDSIASLGLWGDGIGLNYHYGLFRQRFQAHQQCEFPDAWQKEPSWLTKTQLRFPVAFGFGDVEACLYQIDVSGYENGIVNHLNLFDVAQPAQAPAKGIDFDQTDIPHQLTSFLYPDDSTQEGRLLRIYQQYFMVSAGAQLILHEVEARGGDVRELSRYAVIQINDTHPSMVIPELIRLLTARGMDFARAAEEVQQTCAYTNHTILAEALEKWPLEMVQTVAPQLIPIIEQLDALVRTRFDDPSVAIIDAQERIHMAHMDIHFSRSTNGVAALHTEILKSSELRAFYKLYPTRFQNKTNGITFRRWLMGINPELAQLIDRHIGTQWRTQPETLTQLLGAPQAELCTQLLRVKTEKKAQLRDYLAQKEGIFVPEDAIFDVQIKRLHEYKRQQMNALYAIWKYFEIKAGRLPARPITLLFGAKAAPAYTIAKDIIHLILCLQTLFARDAAVAPHLQIVMVENYNVSYAERLIPAADISEQISLASKEASGTGNMKFMANGAITLGTLDGANVEIAQLVGEENIFLFGKRSEEVLALYDSKGYDAAQYYKLPEVQALVDFLLSPELLALGNKTNLTRLHKELIGKDWFMTLLDLQEYIRTKEQMLAAYENRTQWSKMMLQNIAKSGFFSSDRTIRQYNEEIWHLD